MDQIEFYLVLLTIITCTALLFRRSAIPISLILVIIGMICSFLPGIPIVTINSKLILDGFLPLLLYTASYATSFKEMKANVRPIALLSVGHVLFITVLVAITIHALIPEFGWPLAFILGAVIAPPDDVAILAIAEKLNMPSKLVTILRGEALLNDATALIIFKFALAALITHQFSPFNSLISFFVIVTAETLYGFVLACAIGEIRVRIQDPTIQVLISLLTPFIAYLPTQYIFGSGVVATVVTGIVIGQRYWGRFSADVRLNTRSVWNSLEFTLQSILFLLVGLDFKFALSRISTISSEQLILYATAITAVVIIGRFAWVYPSAYLPRMLFSSIRKKEPSPPWQYPFIISWAGMRGGISLAAALAVPDLPDVNGLHPRSLLIFLVFIVIVATLLIQGLTLPWVIRMLGVHHQGQQEKDLEHQAELSARAAMTNAALQWLNTFSQQVKIDTELAEQVQLRIKVYQSLEQQIKQQLTINETLQRSHFSAEQDTSLILLGDIIEIERRELDALWRENKISQSVKIKLEKQLDLRAKHIEELA